MLGVIGQLLPLAIAVALSSVPILAALVLLLEAKRPLVPTLFVVGYLVGLVVITSLFAIFLHAVPADTSTGAPPVVGVLEIVAGIALLVYAGIEVRRRRRKPERESLPRWMVALGRMRPAAALGLGLALTVRPKSILLAIAAGLVIGPAQLPAAQDAVAIAVFVVIGASSVGGPALFAVARPDAARPALSAAQGWLLRNDTTVAIVVAAVIGTVILGNGLTRL
ncbi:GAP family protein [Leifsonia sp. AG29]|uniref:GAP family protein n=1 Tax=Leifsonia sp. AG29 TaxID=2598860 RepID=UPI00131A8EA1|nr:GAP family protein [Leifsonia sp. AG29]